jgi:hypothetical protein
MDTTFRLCVYFYHFMQRILVSVVLCVYVYSKFMITSQFHIFGSVLCL